MSIYRSIGINKNNDGAEELPGAVIVLIRYLRQLFESSPFKKSIAS